MRLWADENVNRDIVPGLLLHQPDLDNSMHPKIQFVWSLIKDSWQRYAIALVCVSLVILRIAFPTINVDSITLFLLSLAAIALVIPTFGQLRPHLLRALPYIRKARIAGIEVELTDEIMKISQDVDKAQKAVSEKGGLFIGEEFAAKQAEILEELKTDPKAAFLLLAAKIEQQIMARLEKHGLRRPSEFIPIQRAIQVGVEHGVFPSEILGMVNDFWAIRNQVAHGMAFDVDSSVVLSLNSVGLEILKFLSAERQDGPIDEE